jgi:hypothetical protein
MLEFANEYLHNFFAQLLIAGDVISQFPIPWPLNKARIGFF